jgi:hypothetical protein
MAGHLLGAERRDRLSGLFRKSVIGANVERQARVGRNTGAVQAIDLGENVAIAREPWPV